MQKSVTAGNDVRGLVAVVASERQPDSEVPRGAAVFAEVTTAPVTRLEAVALLQAPT
ncbi:hypothetical protein [Pantoea stewartii]|uniref:hypothetical protein n=1 Tax=Pantoea stewartii TaxID=66269 RepID=UPI0013635D05|nr:hypothetical protein [Pantoea stewartii]